MGNKLGGCACGPLIRKTYRYEDYPWLNLKRRDGHLLRLWAEVFHISAHNATSVKWQQVSEDLVPVCITCIQDSPECVFHITAYNSQVDKILDVRLVQPGTRLSQASDCFIYWRDGITGDTWGLNFTSAIDAKQFKECCSLFFKFSRKASSSYSLKLDPPHKQSKIRNRRKPQSTPSSPSRLKEPQCTCMTPEEFARLKAVDPRFRAATMPRLQSKAEEGAHVEETTARPTTTADKPTAVTSSASSYHENLNEDKTKQTTATRQTRDRETATPGGKLNTPTGIASQTDEPEEPRKNEGVQAGIMRSTIGTCTPRSSFRGREFSTVDRVRNNGENVLYHARGDRMASCRAGASYQDAKARYGMNPSMSVDSSILKKMLKPMPSLESPITSPEMSNHRCLYQPQNSIESNICVHHCVNDMCCHDSLSEPETRSRYKPRMGNSRSTYDISRNRDYSTNRLYLELEPKREYATTSPPSDNDLYDTQCYTTPMSRGMNGRKQESQGTSMPGSPNSRLLMEYETHLRNTLARGMDAESYSLHTFEALLSESMENLEFAEKLPQANVPSPYPMRRRVTNTGSAAGRGALQSNKHRYSLDPQTREREREKEGYYSDRNEHVRDRGYLSDKDRGYLSDHNMTSNTSRCSTCLGSSARSQWYRHSDGWKSGTSTLSSASSGVCTMGSSFQNEPLLMKRSAWESLPSLRHENSVSDASTSFKLGRSDSLERRALRDRYEGSHHYDKDGSLSQQTSIESADSRLCYLTSSEMSDDDRMSLTTALSDEDDADDVQNSPNSKVKKATKDSASFNCTGAVRKAGFLSVKKWLLRKKKQIEMAGRRPWRGYWVCLKGTTLLFYPCDSGENHKPDVAPRHLIIVDGAIMQPVPEHPKRDYIFCLSTAFGDAYLFQAPCQVELENWINSIHTACSAAFARHRGKTGTSHLLEEEVLRVDKAIESDYKLKHMAELQLSVVSDGEVKQQLINQIAQYEDNMERTYCEQFRLRCYLASILAEEAPNPKNLLSNVSRSTKNTLNKLGVFTVSSIHAYICARSPSLLNNLLAGRGSTKRRMPVLSRSNSGSSRRSLQSMSSREDERTVKVSLPDGQSTQIYLKDAMSVEEYIACACARKDLNAMQHFVRVKKRRDMEDHNYFVPHRSDLIDTYLNTHEVVEICPKILYQVELMRTSVLHMWGFSVEAELVENAERQDELCVFVSRVEESGIAVHNGMIKGDEIMVINGSIVSDLDMMYIESVLQEELSLSMMMRSSRTGPLNTVPSAGLLRNTDDIEALVCPPPPADPPMISEEMISGLIVPAPNYARETIEHTTSYHGYESKPSTSSMMSSMKIIASSESVKQPSRASSLEIENLVKSAGEVTGFCRSPVETGRSSPTGYGHTNVMPCRVLTDAEKLRKVILELIETERAYVQHLHNLLDNYLEPLKQEMFLTAAEISVLYGNIVEIINFQQQFLENLDEALLSEREFHNFDHPSQFKNILFSIGSSFLYYVDHFKLYSSFCASHSKAQKILNPNEGNYALQAFLATRNPRQQHAFTLESYLIKPIQRILKYPLLLQQLRNLTDPSSDEHEHLVEALKGMEKVAEHINEMQRIHEEYGAIFDHLFRQHQKPIDLSPGDLLYYGGVEWINISDFIGKIKKGLELNAMCFVFKSAVVFLCKEKIRQKKKIMSVIINKGDVEVIRYQVLIPVSDLQVRTITKEGEGHYFWELVHMRCYPQRRTERVYILSNTTHDFRNAFIKTIRQTIRESVRNMNIPSGKTVQSLRTPLLKPPISSVVPVKPKPNKSMQVQPQVTSGPSTKPQVPPGKPKKIPPKPPQRRSSTGLFNDPSRVMQLPGSEGHSGDRSKSITGQESRDKPEFDPGTKSEGEDESLSMTLPGKSKTALGRTPNHLTLSTTSTLSTGSTSSQAKLIQSSQPPQKYQPPPISDLGSPVWKPRDLGESLTLPRKNKTTPVDTRTLIRKQDSKKEKQPKL